MDLTTVLNAARVPWNKGKLTGQKPPLKLKEIWAIRIRLQLAARTRDLVMFNLAIDKSVRSDQTASTRYLPWSARCFAGDGHAAKDAKAGSVRNHRANPR